MAKRKKSNIQRRNLPNKPPVGHQTLGNAKKVSTLKEEITYENTYLFTMIGMFVGILIGWFFDNMALGFGIGVVIGAIVDFVLSEKRKKKLAEQEESIQ